jgi:hypothetical protein
LLSCGLKHNHLEIFKDNGFTELEILYEVERTDLRQMGIPTGFSIKLLKRIKASKLSAGEGGILPHRNIHKNKFNNFVGEQNIPRSSNTNFIVQETLEHRNKADD